MDVTLSPLHSTLQSEWRESEFLPFSCKVELELRVGTLEYDPREPARGRWRSGVTRQTFDQLACSFEPHLYSRQELWDSIYSTVEERCKVRVSRDAAGRVVDCICKNWVQDCQLERALGRYDARLNVSREIPAALPLPGERAVYSRHKQRLSILVCESRWRLDLTCSTDGRQRVQYEVELEACEPALFVANKELLCSDLQWCCNLIKTANSYNRTNKPVAYVPISLQSIDNIYQQLQSGSL